MFCITSDRWRVKLHQTCVTVQSEKHYSHSCLIWIPIFLIPSSDSNFWSNWILFRHVHQSWEVWRVLKAIHQLPILIKVPPNHIICLHLCFVLRLTLKWDHLGFDFLFRPVLFFPFHLTVNMFECHIIAYYKNDSRHINWSEEVVRAVSNLTIIVEGNLLASVWKRLVKDSRNTAD